MQDPTVYDIIFMDLKKKVCKKLGTDFNIVKDVPEEKNDCLTYTARYRVSNVVFSIPYEIVNDVIWCVECEMEYHAVYDNGENKQTHGFRKYGASGEGFKRSVADPIVIETLETHCSRIRSLAKAQLRHSQLIGKKMYIPRNGWTEKIWTKSKHEWITSRYVSNEEKEVSIINLGMLNYVGRSIQLAKERLKKS